MRSVLTEFMVKLGSRVNPIPLLSFLWRKPRNSLRFFTQGGPRSCFLAFSLGGGCLETAFRTETLSCLPSPTPFPFAQSLNNEQMRKVKASCLPVSFELFTYAVLFFLFFVSLFCYCCCCTFPFGLLFVFYFSVL